MNAPDDAHLVDVACDNRRSKAKRHCNLHRLRIRHQMARANQATVRTISPTGSS